jgi:hypothetical protein
MRRQMTAGPGRRKRAATKPPLARPRTAGWAARASAGGCTARAASAWERSVT